MRAKTTPSCAATAANGQRCKMAPMRGERFCFRHSPKTAKARKVASARGGRHGRIPKAHTPADVTSIDELQKHLGQVLADVMLHPNTLQRGATVARLLGEARQLIEVGDLERRLALIEARLDMQDARAQEAA